MKKIHLTLEQRYQIQVLLSVKTKQKDIAIELGKDKSVISREIRRNKRSKGRYNAQYAQELCTIRKERLKCPRKLTDSMKSKIIRELKEDHYSPEQIKGSADKAGIAMVSHERIYQLIRADKEHGGNLYDYTRHRLKHRKRPVGGKKVVIKNRRSIHDRASLIDEKKRFGDWEIDTIVGPNNKGAILTLVERQTGFLMMEKLPKGKNAFALAKCVINMLAPFKKDIHSITADNGTEFAAHQHISKKLQADFFFADPYSSWQRGLNEYTNKLIRQYIPKKQPFKQYNDPYIKMIQTKINARPRKKLNFSPPKDLFFSSLT
jgi:IS30 family transposase